MSWPKEPDSVQPGSPRPFLLAIASGKGGTGKTLVSTNIAALAAHGGSRVVLADCDVEAPNDHLFLEPSAATTTVVEASVAEVTSSACTACGNCRDTCTFGAVRVMGGSALVFDELCHGCEACVDVCPTGAIVMKGRRVGTVESGDAVGRPGLKTITGRLDIGQVKAPTVIHAVRSRAASEPAEVVVLDAPPGVACAAVAAVRGADALLLVTEPTPFGLHDLKLGLQLGVALGVPMAVFVNKVGTGTADIDSLCREFGVPIVARLPFDRQIAEAYAVGSLLVDVVPESTGTFASVIPAMRELGSRARGWA